MSNVASFIGPADAAKQAIFESCVREALGNSDDPFEGRAVIEYSAPIEYALDGTPVPSSKIFTTHPKGN